jgi:glycosyltransferase involved in cell wall biosynthesis
VRAFRPDIIHCEHEQESLMALQAAAARALAAPGSALVLFAWQNLVRRRGWPVRLLSWLTRRAAQHVMCASREAEQVLRAQGFRGGTSVLPLFGLDERFFSPRPPAAGRQRLGVSGFVVGAAGRLVPEKGLDTLLHAAARVTARVPVSVALIGDGPEAGRLRALAEALGLQRRLAMPGAVPYDRMADCLSALDVLALPSRTTAHWKEQFGRVLVEALACGVPVVGSRTGAIPEVIGPGGLLFPEGDADALAACLTQLADDEARRRALAAAGRAHVLANYSVQRLAEGVLDIWRGLRPATLSDAPRA